MLKKIARKALGRKGSGLEGYQYFIDAVTPELIVGWAVNTNNKQHKPIVDICVNDAVLWQTKAELPREDLAEAGIGDFAFRLEPSASVLQQDLTQVDIHIDGHKVNEQPYPFAMNCPAKGQLQSHFGMAHEEYTGHVDAISEQVVVGWVRSNAEPGKRLSVSLVCAEGELATVEAGLYRQDLDDRANLNGHYGFRLELPLHKFPASSFECDLLVEGNKVNPQPVKLEVNKQELELAKYKHAFADQITEFDSLVKTEMNRIVQQVESVRANGQEPNLNVTANVALNNIAELSARVSVIERVLAKHFSVDD